MERSNKKNRSDKKGPSVSSGEKEIAKTVLEEGRTHWGVIFIEMNRLSVGECIKRLSLYADVLSPEEMKNQIEFL